MRIAFLQFGAMGDVLYATPILRQVRVNNPDAYICWFIEQKFEDLVKYNYMLDDVKTWDHTFFPGRTKQDKEKHMWENMKVMAEDYDKIVAPQWWPDCPLPWDGEEDLLTLMAKCAGIERLVKRDIICCTTSDIRSNASFEIEKAKEGKRKLVTINHHSYTVGPVWPLEFYEMLAAELYKHDIGFIFSGGKTDPFPSNIQEHNKFTGSFLIWKEMIDMSNLWLGIDTGAMALACGTQTPIITLRKNEPYPITKTGIRAMGIREKNVAEMVMSGQAVFPVEDVFRKIVQNLS